MNTLAEVYDQVNLWSERSDITDAQLDSFTKLVEVDFKKDLFLPPNEVYATLTTDVNGEITIPTDYLKAKHLRAINSEGNVQIIYRKPNEFVTLSGSFWDPDTPSYFERMGNKFIFSPNPGAGTDIQFTYYAIIPSMIDIALADPDGANFVLAVMPTIYLFGILMYLFMYTFNEERALYYKGLYDMAKQDLIEMQNEAEMSGSSLHIVPTLSDSGRTY